MEDCIILDKLIAVIMRLINHDEPLFAGTMRHLIIFTDSLQITTREYHCIKSEIGAIVFPLCFQVRWADDDSSQIEFTHPGKKRKDHINLYYKDAELNDSKEIREVELRMYSGNTNYWTVESYDMIKLLYDGENWSVAP